MREPAHSAELGEGVLAPGERLGRYRVLRPLAVGGMAELHLAHQQGAGGVAKTVVLKRIRPHLAGDAEFARLFENEARLAAGLDHSGIAHVLDYGVEGGLSFIVMEYVHGPSLLELLKKTAPQAMPLAVGLSIVRDIAAALHYAHERTGADGHPLGIVHRDVSPSNVLLTYDGEVKLVDFGIAKATALPQATRSTSIKGKIAYMSPEQAKGERVDRRTDVFALGTVAFEVLTASRCFTAAGELALLNKVAVAQYPKPSSIDPAFDPALEQLLARALSVRPEDRFATARAFQEAVETYAASRGLSLSNLAVMQAVVDACGRPAYPVTTDVLEPLPAVGTTSRVTGSRRRRWAWPAAAGVCLLLGAGGGVWAGRQGKEPPLEERTEPAEAPTPAAALPESKPAPTPVEKAAPEQAPEVREPESESAVESAAPAPAKRRKKKRRRPRSSPTTSKSGEDAKAAAPEYLPPSRR
ncbi:MAG: serine/threonine-protein kinase [Myxococcota bacterium]